MQRLPPYPSASARKSLTPGQLAQLNQDISLLLAKILALKSARDAATASQTFVSTYAKHTALQDLQSLVWDVKMPNSTIDKIICTRALLLAEKISSISPNFDIQTLVDLAIVYAPTHPIRLRALFVSCLEPFKGQAEKFATEIVPAFTKLLAAARTTGLYGLRKTAHCVSSIIHVSPPEVVRYFSCSRDFVVALASAYDESLASIARSYGGLKHNLAVHRQLDEWERIWLETKVALIDAFHCLADQMLNDLSKELGMASSGQTDQTFDILFSILDISSNAGHQSNISPTPFLNRSLLADYEQTYAFSRKLASLMVQAEDRDPRLDVLEASLSSLENDASSNGNDRNKDPGALILLLQASGPSPSVTATSTEKPQSSTILSAGDKGKSKAKPSSIISPHFNDPELDLKVTQVQEIMPDFPSEYIRALLTHPRYPFKGDPEKVVEALLEGTAPTIDELEPQLPREPDISGTRAVRDEFVYTRGRQNAFDGDEMDLSLVRFGKKRQDEKTVLHDRTFIEEMKADILRRAEAISDDEDIDQLDTQSLDDEKKAGPLADEEELGPDGVSGLLKLMGDGGDHSEDMGDGADGEDDDEVDATQQRPTPETVLELAYIRDPKLFDRDAQTRRSKARANLKTQTGWTDEQIEGWRIMLERNPKKDRILQKHEFSGNRLPPESSQNRDGEGGSNNHSTSSGRGRGSRGGRGRGGRGRGTASASGDGGDARDRAWKDRNKASRGNHNRKRGHDKKMARAGGPS